MKLLAYLYLNLWVRFWIWYWGPSQPIEQDPEVWPKVQRLYCPRWLQPYIFAELNKTSASVERPNG